MSRETLNKLLGVRVSDKTFRELEELRQHLGLSNTSEVIRFLVAQGARIWKQGQELGDGHHPQV